MSWDRKPRQASTLAESLFKMGNSYVRDYDFTTSFKKKTKKSKKKGVKKSEAKGEDGQELLGGTTTLENVEMGDLIHLQNGNQTNGLHGDGVKTNASTPSATSEHASENWDSDGNIDLLSVEDLVPDTNGKEQILSDTNTNTNTSNHTHTSNLTFNNNNTHNTNGSDFIGVNNNNNNHVVNVIDASVAIETALTITPNNYSNNNNNNNNIINGKTLITTTNLSENVFSIPLPSISTDNSEKAPHIALVLRRKIRFIDQTEKASQPKKKSKKKSKLGNGLSDSEGDDVPLFIEGKDPIKMARMIQRLRAKPFTYIKTNSFLGRSKRIEDEDSISICFCVPIENEGGCGSNCVNRLTYMECNPSRCPCGELCRNQRFQKMEYAKVGIIKTEQKGYGLVALEPLQVGDFVYEYCGEVISNEICLDRLSTATEESNFYFLTLDSRECIDASGKGNLARFMNHSCDPNCQTQKWYVSGELRVGLFAIKDIPVGSELTFDYNFERFGREKQRCFCKAPNCRGFLGEKPNKSEEAKKKGSAKRKNATKKSGGLPIFISSPTLSSTKKDATITTQSSSSTSMNNTNTNYNVNTFTPNTTEKSESKSSSSTVNSNNNGTITHIHPNHHTIVTNTNNNNDISNTNNNNNNDNNLDNNNNNNNTAPVNASILKESEVLPDGTIIPSQPKKRKNLHLSDHDPYISYLLQNNSHYIPEHLRQFISQTCHTSKFTSKFEKVVHSEVIETDGKSKKILTTETERAVVVPPRRLPVFLSRNVLKTREWWKKIHLELLKKHGKLSPSKPSNSNVVPNIESPSNTFNSTTSTTTTTSPSTTTTTTSSSHPTNLKKRNRTLIDALKTLGVKDSPSNFLVVLEKGFSEPTPS